jgi:anti-sigma-K factor RskA
MGASRRRGNDDELAELAALADGSLAPDRRAALEAQVAASPEVAAQLAAQQRAVALAQSAASQVDAPASLRARIEAQRRPERSSRPHRLVWIGGLAAASVAAVAIGIAVAQTSSSEPGFHAALVATELAPGASADATLDKTDAGWRIELDATGLPRRDGGLFYEAWLKNAAGTLVPIGTFNEGGKVTLWAGVSPQDFTTLTVTRERADGDQTSSGEKVLVGAITGE